MDTITQITLGASVGEALLGKKTGYKGAAWGAFLGTFPDLDVLGSVALDSVGELQFHRGFTHSILFCFIASPLFGWLIHRIHKQDKAGWRSWTLAVFLIFATHILIDVFTSYGTQIFYPFSNLPVTTDSVFIIDPLYTLPLLAGLVTALLQKKNSTKRRIANYAGLAVSSLYLMWGLAIKPHVNSVFESSFHQQFGCSEQIKTIPNGPTTFLWNGYIIKDDTLYHSLYSIFDESTELEFTRIPRNSHLLTEHRGDRAVDVLLWFSRGYYSVEASDGELLFYDLRFGRNDLWLAEGEFTWKNVILFSEDGVAENIEQTFPSFSARSETFNRFWNRIWGI